MSLAVAATAVVAALLLYAPVVSRLVSYWATDENYTHGYLVAPLALVIAWANRARWLPIRPAPGAGAFAVGGAILLLLIGERGSELYLTRLSLIAACAGSALLLAGWPALRALTLPLVLLLLTVPLPSLVFAQLTMPLQTQAAVIGTRLLDGTGVSVLRQGNVLMLPAASLEVADACSGIRSIFALISLSLLLGYWRELSTAWRIALLAAVIPVVLLVNGLRVAVLGWAVEYWGEVALHGWQHTVSGYASMVTGAAMLFAIVALHNRIHASRSARSSPRLRNNAAAA